METTIAISDGLFGQVKRHAAAHRMTPRAVIEAALCRFPQVSGDVAPTRFRLRRHASGGSALQAGLDAQEWGAITERAYEGHGG